MKIKSLVISACLLALSSVAFAGPKVGLVQLVEHPSLDEIRAAIVEQLKAEVPDVEVDYQNGQNNPSVINSICQKFIGNGVDLIVTIATPAAQGAAAATDKIPVVFAAVTDPVAAGLVEDLNHPGGNVTGTSDRIPTEKIFELAKEITPNVKRYGILFNPGEINSATVVKSAKEVLKAQGIEVKEANVTNSSEVTSATQSLLGKVDALFVPIDNTVASAMVNLSQLAIDAKTPVYAAADSLVHDGALATVGVNYTNLGKETGHMAAEVLKGANPADMPVKVLDKFNRVFNDETAKSLGIDISSFKN